MLYRFNHNFSTLEFESKVPKLTDFINESKIMLFELYVAVEDIQKNFYIKERLLLCIHSRLRYGLII